MALRANPFIWTPDRKAQAKHLYLVENLTPTAIAEQIGGGCSARTVIRYANRHGLAKQRDPAVTRAFRLANVAVATKVSASVRSPAPVSAKPHAAGRGLPADLQAAIADAVAAGKVTILPAGSAAGLSVYERQFYAAPPPRNDPEAHAEAVARGRRAGRKSALSHAGRKAIA